MSRFFRILALAALAIPSHAFAVDPWSLQIFGGAPNVAIHGLFGLGVER